MTNALNAKTFLKVVLQDMYIYKSKLKMQQNRKLPHTTIPNRKSKCSCLHAISLVFLGVILFINDAGSQLPDNGINRNRDYNDYRFNSESSVGGSQTILEVVKSINYLSEVSTS